MFEIIKLLFSTKRPSVLTLNKTASSQARNCPDIIKILGDGRVTTEKEVPLLDPFVWF